MLNEINSLKEILNCNLCIFVMLLCFSLEFAKPNKGSFCPHIVVMHCAITVTKFRLKLKTYTRLFSTLASGEIQPKVRKLNELPLKTSTYTNRPLSSPRALIGRLSLLPQ